MSTHIHSDSHTYEMWYRNASGVISVKIRFPVKSWDELSDMTAPRQVWDALATQYEMVSTRP